MNRDQLVAAAGAKLGDPAAADTALAALCVVVVEAVARGERVTVDGFGVFRRVRRPAMRTVPATYVPKFESGEDFQAAVAAPHRLPDVKREPPRT